MVILEKTYSIAYYCSFEYFISGCKNLFSPYTAQVHRNIHYSTYEQYREGSVRFSTARSGRVHHAPWEQKGKFKQALFSSNPTEPETSVSLKSPSSTTCSVETKGVAFRENKIEIFIKLFNIMNWDCL